MTETVRKLFCLFLSWILFFLDFPSDDQFPLLCNLYPSRRGQSAWVILWSSDLRLTKIVHIRES